MNITLKVAAVVVNDKQKVLLIKEQYNKDQGFKWNLVKGTFDNPDETIEECVKREISEEVNLSVDSVELKKVFHYGSSENPKILFVFYCNYKDNKDFSTKNNRVDENIVEVKWFSQKDIKKFSKEDFMAEYVHESIKNYLNPISSVSKLI